MSRLAERHRAEKELFRETQKYYAAIRRPWLEWTTFALALVTSVAVASRTFGIGIVDYKAEGEWVITARWLCLFLFAFLDTMIAKQRHPMPAPAFFSFFGRIYEKFAMQGRAWQLLLVLMLPVTARLVAALVAAVSAR